MGETKIKNLFVQLNFLQVLVGRVEKERGKVPMMLPGNHHFVLEGCYFAAYPVGLIREFNFN